MRAEVFAVEDTSVQLTWRGGPGGRASITVDGIEAQVDTEPGPGAATIGGLRAGAEHQATVRCGGAPEVTLAFRTLDPPAGPVRSRVATISDLHLGQKSFGHRNKIVEQPRPTVNAGIRCARSALHAAAAWGADLIVVKGDLTNNGRQTEWRQAAELFAEIDVPVVVLPGNHDTGHHRTIEPWQAGERYGLHVVRRVEAIDLPGIRLVIAPTTIIGRSRGHIDHRRDDILAAAKGSPAALVVLHHHLELRPDPLIWPPGIPRAQAYDLLHALGEVQPASLVTSGHTHRHRRFEVGPVTVTQVGSTKDYPGAWAGYAIHDGGIRQLVRRVEDPSCLRWTDSTRRAVGGLWGHLSPGHLSARCFTRSWD